MLHDRKPDAGIVVVHFALIALSSAIAVYVIGVLSVFAYVLWSAGWDLGLWLLEVLS